MHSKKVVGSIFVLLLGLLLANKPLIRFFNMDHLIGSVPSLYVWLFLVWFGVIISVAIIYNNKNVPDK